MHTSALAAEGVESNHSPGSGQVKPGSEGPHRIGGRRTLAALPNVSRTRCR